MPIQLNLDLDRLYELAKLHCTGKEMSVIMGCDERTLTKSIKYTEIIKKGRENGRERLRHLQFRIAEGRRAEFVKDEQGNVIKDEKGKPMIDKPGYAPVPAMAIFLGKNMLGQSDQQTLNIHTEKPVEVIIKNYEKEEKKKEK